MLHTAPRFFLVILSLSAIPALFGCSRQNEGERCAPTNGDSDCEDKLVCTELSDGDGTITIHRCCPKAGESSTDERCELQAGGGDGDAMGDGGEGGMTSSEGDLLNRGDNCVYNSDCNLPLVCLQGKCTDECQRDRDCDAGKSCSNDKVCVAD
jgi:hypothetical protein